MLYRYELAKAEIGILNSRLVVKDSIISKHDQIIQQKDGQLALHDSIHAEHSAIHRLNEQEIDHLHREVRRWKYAGIGGVVLAFVHPVAGLVPVVIVLTRKKK